MKNKMLGGFMLLELKVQMELWLQCPDAFRMCRPRGRAKSRCGKEPGDHVLRGQQGQLKCSGAVPGFPGGLWEITKYHV